MPISFGNNSITGISVGNQNIAEAYIGSTKIWPEEPAYNHDWVWPEDFGCYDSSTTPITTLNEPYIYGYWPEDTNTFTRAVFGYISNGYSNGDVDITVVSAVTFTPADEEVAFYNPAPYSIINQIWGRYITCFTTAENINTGDVIRVPAANIKVVPVNYMNTAFSIHNVYNQGDNTLSYWLSCYNVDSTNGQMMNQQFYLSNGIQHHRAAFYNLAYNNMNTGGYKLDFNEPGSLLTTFRDYNWWTPAFGLMDYFQSWGTVPSHISLTTNSVSLTAGASGTVYSHVDQGRQMIFPSRAGDRGSRLQPDTNAQVSGTTFTTTGTLTTTGLVHGNWYCLTFYPGHNITDTFDIGNMTWGTDTINVYPVGIGSFVNIEP